MGQEEVRYNISNITNANPCVITTDEDNAFVTGDYVRLTDLGNVGPMTNRGCEPLNDQKFKIIVNGADTFYLKDPTTNKDIDSTDFTPYTSGGSCNLVQENFIYEDEE